MNGPGTTTRAHLRRPTAATVGVIVAAVVASVLWWSAAGTAVAPGQSGSSHPGSARIASGPPTGLVVQAATGRGIAGRWGPPASGPPPDSYQVRVVSSTGGVVVATAQTWSPSAVVSGLDVGGTYQMVVTPSGVASSGAGALGAAGRAGASGPAGASGRAGSSGASAISPTVVVLADQHPNAPATVTIAQLPGTNGLRVTWTPDPAGVAATGALVRLYDGIAYRGFVQCEVGCTTVAFRGLAYGRRYTVRVVPRNDAGDGPATTSNPVDLRSPCPEVSACVTIDATIAVGPARLRAQGFLNSLYPVGAMVARTRDLAPRSWRGSPTYLASTGTFDWSSWDAAVATGAPTTMLLSNLWDAETNTGTGSRPPWADWAAYSAWVTNTVRAIEASRHPVAFWEIQNEPGAPSYFSPADWAASTVTEYLEQFRVAYGAIKAADPAARIIAPSLSHFADYPGEYDSHEPDLVTFLDYAASRGMQLAAVSWHEIDNDLGAKPRDFNRLPEMIEDHVAEARRLIAERPSLGHPEVWVNEYGRPVDNVIPGWSLGDIAALEGASVDRAGRTCWPEQVPGGAAYDDCAAPTLDGLLALDGSTPRADYWVYATYARMTGKVVTTRSNDAAISVLATRDDASAHVVAMVGRHVSCLPGVNLSCTQPDAVTVSPVSVYVGVRVPWSGPEAQVSIARVSPTWAPVPAPVTIFQGLLPVAKGVVYLSLPAVADGEVYLVTLGR